MESTLKLILEKLNIMQTDMDLMKTDITLIKTQQNEHGAILAALKVASETHKADTDNLNIQVSKISQEIKSEFKLMNNRLTKVEENVESIEKDIKFIKHKEFETEQKIFEIKNHLTIAK